jgi:D-sedoheptulose 7-phosphate isomerase
MSLAAQYLADLRSLIDALDVQQLEALTDALYTAWRHGRKVLLCANGGSSATASHIVNDLQKCMQLDTGRALRTMCLSDCTPLILAWGNDTEFSNIYAPQVEAWMEPGDLLIAISGSGNSPNVLNAVEAAHKVGAATWGMAGFGGGKLAALAQNCLTIHSDSMQRVEDLHMIALHIAFLGLRRRALDAQSG